MRLGWGAGGGKVARGSFINVVVSCLDVFEPPSEVRSDAADRMEVGE